MVRSHAEIGKEQLFSAWVLATAVWLSSNEIGVDVIQCFRIVRFENPAFLAGVVLIEDSEVQGLFLIRPSPAPGLIRAGIAKPRLGIQIVRVKDQPLGLGKENTAIRLVGLPCTGYVMHLGDVEVARSHQLSNVA